MHTYVRMRVTPLRWLASLVAATGFLLGGGLAEAQSWPSRPIKLIVAFPAGSATDSIARLVTKDMSETLGQPIVVENRAGAGGAIAAEAVARAAPDGYTLLMGSNTQFAANVSLYKKLPYNPVTDFVPVVRLTTQPTVLLVRIDFPAKTVSEFIAYAKASPKKLSGGFGSASTQVGIAKLRQVSNVDFLDVPYKGIPQAVIDVIGGTLDFTFADLGTGLTQVKGGKVRALGVTSATRSALAPDWPAISDTYPGVDIFGWHAIVAPVGTPPDIVQKLYGAAAAAMAKPSVIEGLASLGVSPALLRPEELGRFIPEDIRRWAEMVSDAGITPE
jgi:tripartite-type tricarboxylate transporter receptor subunit TctC